MKVNGQLLRIVQTLTEECKLTWFVGENYIPELNCFCECQKLTEVTGYTAKTLQGQYGQECTVSLVEKYDVYCANA